MSGKRVERACILAALLILGLMGPLPTGSGAESWVKDDMGTPGGGGRIQLFGVAVGDGDRDGSSEVYFTARQSGGVYQYTYDEGSGNWSIENVVGPNFNADTVVLGDADDSGDKELYVIGVNRAGPRPRISVFQLYHDSAGWHEANVASASSNGNELAIGDGNNDSRTELFGACSDGHIYMYYKINDWNSQDIGYAPPPSNQDRPSMEGVAVGDGDNDGRPEVYGSAASGWVYRFSYSDATSSWTRTEVGRAETDPRGSSMAGVAIGDVDGDGKNEVYGASWTNATIYKFSYDPGSSQWERTSLVSLGNQAFALGLAVGDGNSDGADELYAGTSNNQVYKIFHSNATGSWLSSSVGSGNGPMNDIAVGSATGDPSQRAVYAACQDGHGYQFMVDRIPPGNPAVWSDTHPEPGTWYTANIVHVLWKDSGKDVSGIDGYSFSWDNSPSTVPDEKKEVEESVHEATSLALSPGKWYFHIRARDNALNWNATAAHFGPVCIGSAPDTAPPEISDVRVSGITDKLAVVSWRTNEPADSAVEYGTSGSYGLKAADAGFALEHGLTLTGLQPSTTYHFRAMSSDASGNGPAASGDHTFTTLAAPDVTPPVISNVRVSGLTDRVAVITWETDEPADSALDYGTTASYGSELADGQYVFLHELTLSGLNASTIYHIRVRSTDTTGNGPATSADLSFTTLALPDRTPPQLSNLRVEGVNDSSASVLWETDEVADGFVEYGPTTAYGLSAADRTFTLHHSLQLQGLAPDREYHLRALSADPSGNTGTGEDLVFRTAKTPSLPDRTPPVLSGVGVSGISDTRAVVIWYTDELADGEVEYGTTAAYGLRASDAAYTFFHSIVLENLAASTEYHLRAGSRDVSGNGPAVSQDLKFTTAAAPDTAPPRITGINVTGITATSATITWTTDEPSTSIVEFGNDTGYGRRQVSGLNVLQHSMVLTGLSPGRVYHFRVSSVDPGGNAAAPSADLNFTTLGGGGPAAAPTSSAFPWLWLGLAIVLMLCVAGAILAYRRRALRKGAPPGTTGPVLPAAGTAGAPDERPAALAGGLLVEEPETLEMDGEPPVQDDWEEIAAPGAAPAASTISPAPAAPPAPVPLRHIRCPKCRTRIPIYGEGVQKISCPSCGTSGEYRPKGMTAKRDQGPGTTAAEAPPLSPGPEPRAPGPRTTAAEAAPLSPGPEPRSPGPAPLRMTRCTGCGSKVPIFTSVYPARITCPNCGRSGAYRGPRV